MEENEKIKKGKPRIFTDIERVQRKSLYMTSRPWFCDICNNGINYTLSGKSQHRYTRKHRTNMLLKVRDLNDKVRS